MNTVNSQITNKDEIRISAWGIKVKQELPARHISMTDLALALGYSRPYISSVVNGIIIAPQIVEKINKYFGWS